MVQLIRKTSQNKWVCFFTAVFTQKHLNVFFNIFYGLVYENFSLYSIRQSGWLKILPSVFGLEACSVLLCGVESAPAASCYYNQNLHLYTCNRLNLVTELFCLFWWKFIYFWAVNAHTDMQRAGSVSMQPTVTTFYPGLIPSRSQTHVPAKIPVCQTSEVLFSSSFFKIMNPEVWSCFVSAEHLWKVNVNLCWSGIRWHRTKARPTQKCTRLIFYLQFLFARNHNIVFNFDLCACKASIQSIHIWVDINFFLCKMCQCNKVLHTVELSVSGAEVWEWLHLLWCILTPSYTL